MVFTNNVVKQEKPINNRFYQRVAKYCFLLTITTGLSLQTVASEDERSRYLTLSDAIQRTFNHNPELQTFQFQLEAHQGKIVQAELSPKPEIELSIEDALGTGDLKGFSNAQTTLSVSWILDQSIKEKRASLAVQGKMLVESEKAIKRLDSATQTARFFLKTLSLQESSVIASRAIALAKETVNEVNSRVKAGKTPSAELYRAEAELAKRELVLVDLKHKRESSIRQLAAQWGETSPTFKSVSGTFASRPEVVSFIALKNLIDQNPRLDKYLSVERIREAELTLAREERRPLWQFKTGLRRIEATDDYGLVTSVSIPYGGSNRNQGRIAQVRANISQNQSEAEALRIRIETSLYVVYQQLQRNLHLSDILKKDIIPRLEKALTSTQKAYELGKYSYLEWRAVQNELLDAQSALLEANLAAHLNRLEIERLTGAQITSTF